MNYTSGYWKIVLAPMDNVKNINFFKHIVAKGDKSSYRPRHEKT